jgi:hypothetical protein
MIESLRKPKLALLIILLSSFWVVACATSESFVKERDSSADWTKHTTLVGSKSITFELPPGGNFNPEPNTRPLKFGSVALGGVSYGQRPQGRELSDLMVGIGTRRYVPKLPSTSWRYEEFAKWADSETQDFHTLVESKAVVVRQNRWHYQRVTSKKTGLVAQETYKLPFDETSYLLVAGSLGSVRSPCCKSARNS